MLLGIDAEAVGAVLLPAAPPAQPGRRPGTGTYPVVGLLATGFWRRSAFRGSMRMRQVQEHLGDIQKPTGCITYWPPLDA